MTDLIEAAKRQIETLLKEAYERAAGKGTLPEGITLRGTVEIPKDVSYGDYASSAAMAAAREARMAPVKIARALLDEIRLEGTYFKSAEIAGAGFINFRLGDKWFSDVISCVEAEGEDYGRVDVGHGERVMVEFVSANPTGPMTIGNARGGVLGDALAAVLSRAGYDVSREFYVNDAGNQVDLFGRSIDARYMQLVLGEDAVEFPDNGYHGDDIKELAREIFDENGDRYASMPVDERRQAFIAYGLPRNIARMKRDLERYGIHFDTWFL